HTPVCEGIVRRKRDVHARIGGPLTVVRNASTDVIEDVVLVVPIKHERKSDLFLIVDRADHSGLLLRFAEGRQQQPREDRDDRDYDQKFDQSEGVRNSVAPCPSPAGALALLKWAAHRLCVLRGNACHKSWWRHRGKLRWRGHLTGAFHKFFSTGQWPANSMRTI